MALSFCSRQLALLHWSSSTVVNRYPRSGGPGYLVGKPGTIVCHPVIPSSLSKRNFPFFLMPPLSNPFVSVSVSLVPCCFHQCSLVSTIPPLRFFPSFFFLLLFLTPTLSTLMSQPRKNLGFIFRLLRCPVIQRSGSP